MTRRVMSPALRAAIHDALKRNHAAAIPVSVIVDKVRKSHPSPETSDRHLVEAIVAGATRMGLAVEFDKNADDL
ncbi:hypothetical protein [Aquamicrobium zhengzhouense]|uniref:Uncharacterized protein n=1 Tax=Aquamicrobium zhengzhouense TaxID=2781738 RepID=A0ABS0SCN2_9HYPH|nr:hypothetical protein [Aquamicrobium zhengzhouense]MBI1620183.1 hypothetical protein [Aquamicrobium zhengzhouense]